MTDHSERVSRYFRLPMALCGALAAGLAVAEPAPPDDRQSAANFHCIVMPHAVIDVSSGAAGRLDAVHVERGDTVSAQQLVAELESGVERAQLALADTRATINTEIRLRQAEQQVDARNADRIATLHASHVVSAQQREAAERDASVATLRVREAREKRRLAGLELVRAEEILKLRAVRSPIAGVVVDRFKWPGEFVEDDPIIRVAQLDPLRVEVILPVAAHRKLRIGSKVSVFPETEPDSPRIAIVTVVDPMADPASGTFRTTLELPNPDNALLAGIKCNARLVDDSESTPTAEPEADKPELEPYAPRVPGSVAPRAPLRSVALPAPSLADSAIARAHQEQHSKTPRAQGSVPAAQPGEVRSAALSTPEATSAQLQTCQRLGPMAGAAAATQLARALSEAGLQSSVRESISRKTVGFIVLAAQSGAPARTVKQLRAKGVRDLILLRSGDHTGRVSLGVYKGPRQAERRRQAIERRGLSAEVVARTRTKSTWWVDVRVSDAPGDPAGLSAVLSTFAPALPVQASTCAAAMSVAL